MQAGQAIFLHSCEQIFAKRPRWAAVDSYLQSANFAQRLHSLPLVGKLPVIPFLVKMLVGLCTEPLHISFQRQATALTYESNLQWT